ncbi:hypothetical protein N7470_003427 [Penicillium chermesinum]|nr:hypothetical protein N7470_003427 [Penicillium chermesinum]
MSVRVATVGCGHGSLNQIYENVKAQMASRNWDSVDCVIVGGDFQTLRNSYDAACMSVLPKWKQIGDFHEYYSGQRVAPFLTIFCGGNHEAGNYLFELYYGGWVAPNIYYMGAANVLNLGPLRIAGLSGIWKGYDYRKPHFERIPYNIEDVQSIYHVRELDVRKLLQLRTQVDVGISHDWPNGIEKFGDITDLFRRKKHLKDDSNKGALGSKAAREVLDYLRPAYWFSAHLHVRYALTMPHGNVRLAKTKRLPGEPKGWAYEIEGHEMEDQDAPTKKRPSPTVSRSDLDPTRVRRVAVAQAPPGSHVELTETEKLAARNFTNTIAKATGSTEDRLSAWQSFGARTSHFEEEIGQKLREEFWAKNPRSTFAPTDEARSNSTHANEEEVDLGSASSSCSSSGSPPNKKIAMMPTTSEHSAGHAKHSTRETFPPLSQRHLVGALAGATIPSSSGAPAAPIAGPEDRAAKQAVTEDIRSKLPGSLSRPPPRQEQGPKKVPEGVWNRKTKFLALDKPGGRDPFVELLELNPISGNAQEYQRPFRLRYDKEWLAITRVFAHELKLGDPAAVVPANLGDAGYKQELDSAAEWIDQNVVKKNKLDVPENFKRTAPIYNEEVPITTETTEFCALVGITNMFHLSDEERAARMAAGARPNVRPNATLGTRRGTRGGAVRKHGNFKN